MRLRGSYEGIDERRLVYSLLDLEEGGESAVHGGIAHDQIASRR